MHAKVIDQEVSFVREDRGGKAVSTTAAAAAVVRTKEVER